MLKTVMDDIDALQCLSISNAGEVSCYSDLVSHDCARCDVVECIVKYVSTSQNSSDAVRTKESKLTMICAF